MHDPIRKMIKPKSPILYLHEYRHVPEEILLWKNDEHLTPWSAVCRELSGTCEPQGDVHTETTQPGLPPLLCVGIGTYKTLSSISASSSIPSSDECSAGPWGFTAAPSWWTAH